MLSETPLQTRSISVVVVAAHNASILNRTFMEVNGIVSVNDGWSVQEEIVTPAFSRLEYQNGVSWTIDPERLTIVQPIDPKLQSGFLIYEPAARYLSALPHVNYESLGLNWQLSLKCDNPLERLRQLFLSTEVRHLQDRCEFGEIGIESRIGFRFDDAVLFLHFKGDYLQGVDNTGLGLIITDCNLHHEGPLELESLCRRIEQGPELLGSVSEAVTTILETSP